MTGTGHRDQYAYVLLFSILSHSLLSQTLISSGNTLTDTPKDVLPMDNVFWASLNSVDT